MRWRGKQEGGVNEGETSKQRETPKENSKCKEPKEAGQPLGHAPVSAKSCMEDVQCQLERNKDWYSDQIWKGFYIRLVVHARYKIHTSEKKAVILSSCSRKKEYKYKCMDIYMDHSCLDGKWKIDLLQCKNYFNILSQNYPMYHTFSDTQGLNYDQVALEIEIFGKITSCWLIVWTFTF